jgi:DNA mismatch endonuclease (patch repair protein)
MDRMTVEERSRLMSRIRGRDTKPEVLVRQRIYAAGWRYRVCDRRFVGRPDIVVARAKTLIDVRGCFWHRHGCANGTMPKSNVSFWMQKWSRNVKRDKRNEEAWQKDGWNLIVVWECALKNAMARDRTLARICESLDAWAAEVADGKKRRKPHRLVLPRTI